MGAITLPCMLCVHVQSALHDPTVVAGALRNKCGILLNIHSFRKTKYCGMNGSHILPFREHGKAQGKSEKSGEKHASSESGTGLKKALHRGSALNWAASRIQPITDKQLPE